MTYFNAAHLFAQPACQAQLGRIRGWLEALHERGGLHWRGRNIELVEIIAPLLTSLGWQGDARSLADALPHGHGSFNKVDFINTLAMLGYRCERQSGSPELLQSSDLPALYLPYGRNAVPLLILARTVAGLQLFDPASDEVVDRASIKGSGELLRFELVPPLREDAGMPMRWFRSTLRQFAPLFWHIGFVSVLIHFITLFVPFYVMMVYDKVIAARGLDTLAFLSGGVLIALVSEGMLRSLRTRMLSWFGARISTIVNAAMFERLLYLPPSQAEQAPLSAQLARIKAFESVRDFFTGPMFQTLLELPFTLILIIAIAVIAGPVAWIPVAVVVAYIVIALAMRPQWQERSRKAAEAASERQELTMETVAKLDILRQSGTTGRWRGRVETASLRASRTHLKFVHTTSLIEHLSYFCLVLAGVATILFSIERIWAGEMTPGALVATMIITWRVLYPLQMVCNMLPQLEQVRQSIDQVNQLMLLKPEHFLPSRALRDGTIDGQVTFTQVGLRYGRRNDPVLTGISFSLEPGEQLAIVGANGTGKSSVLKLAAGLYVPQAGSVRIDGVDLRQMDGGWIRRHVSYLPQVIDFFPSTLAENLRFHAPLASDAELREALVKADAWDDVMRLGDGLDTQVSPVSTLPSGLMSRLVLARFYIHLQPLVLIDELPYPLLNSRAGERFRDFLRDVRGKHTVIFVTHREDFARDADHVLWLQQDRRAFLSTPNQMKTLEQAV